MLLAPYDTRVLCKLMRFSSREALISASTNFGAFAVSSEDLDSTRYFSTATALTDGRVLIVGGYDANIQTTAQAWIYQ